MPCILSAVRLYLLWCTTEYGGEIDTFVTTGSCECSEVFLTCQMLPQVVLCCLTDRAVFAPTVSHRGKCLLQAIQVSKLSGAVADIAISGLPGWVTVLSPGTKGLIQLRVWAPVGVEVFVRPPIPVPASAQHHSDQLHQVW